MRKEALKALLLIAFLAVTIGVYWYMVSPAYRLMVPYTTESGIDHERPLVVMIPSYNNAEWYQKNLDSVFCQRYTNYRVIYIDDCSSDGTVGLVREYIIKKGQEHRCTVICNTERRWALANHYSAVHRCDDREIIINLDGDDWFAHDQVLQRINAAYQDSGVWLTYGQYEEWPSRKHGHCRQLLPATIRLNCYRECTWVTSALRTFYAGLFKKIRLQDFIYDGDFFHTACDLAFMFPMLEMAAGRCKFLDEVLYIYNCQTPHNDFKESFLLQTHTDYYIRSRPKYGKVDSFLNTHGSTVGVYIFWQGSCVDLATIAHQIKQYITGDYQVHVIVFEDQYFQEDSQPDLDQLFPHLFWHRVTAKHAASDIQSIFDRMQHDYCLCLPDRAHIVADIDLKSCATWLSVTRATGFALLLGTQMKELGSYPSLAKPNFCMVDAQIYGWHSAGKQGPWKVLNPLEGVLISRQYASAIISNCIGASFDQLRNSVIYRLQHDDNFYICYKNPSILWQGMIDQSYRM